MTIIPPARRLAFELNFGLTALMLWLTYTRQVKLFFESRDATENTTAAYYLLSTELQVLGGLFGITIAVLFLAAQIYVRPQYARAVAEVYRDKATWLVLTTLVVTVGFSAVSLVKVNLIVAHHVLFVFDWNLILGGLCLLVLLTLTASQIANIDPYTLARHLVSRITIRKVNEYHLSEVTLDKTGRNASYKLHVYGYQHGREDPLAPFHEIVLWAVQNRDRVALSSLIRLLLARIADGFGTRYSLTPERSARGTDINRLLVKCEMLIRRPLRHDNAIRLTLFLMTYVVRRSQRLREEWGGLDIVRQQYILNIRDLIVSIGRRNGSEDGIRICLFAVMHICLSYARVARYGEDEALRHYYALASDFALNGQIELARLCAQILAVIKDRTSQIPSSLLLELEANMNQTLVEAYQDASAEMKTNPTWLPGTEQADPWRYRVPNYPLEQEPRRIILA